MSDDTKKPESPQDQATDVAGPTSPPAQRTLIMGGAVPPPRATDPLATQPLLTRPPRVTDPLATQSLLPPPSLVIDPLATQPLAGTPLAVEPPPAQPPPAQPLPAMPPPSWGAGSTQRDTIVGQELGGYEVLRRLAEGGMGVVYEGRHTKLGRRAAIKVLKAEYCTSENVVERFYQEARAVNEIHHENIVDVYDFGRDRDGRVFFVMEFLEGESLGARLGRGPLSFAGALPILEQVIRALKAAHDKGFAHRDLKPDNIWLKARDDGSVDVRLLDFGIAKLLGSEAPQERLTRTGAIIGTPTYMSPEQINGAESLDARTDIYSLGIIIYELFAGVTPFQGENLAAIMMGHLLNEPPPLAADPGLGVPDAIAQIVARMLAKKPDERYQTVSEVLADLRAVAQNREPSVASKLDREMPRTLATGAHTGVTAPTTPDRPPAPVAAAPGRRKLLIPLIAIAVAGGAAAAYVATRGGDGSSTPSTASGPGAPTGPTTDPAAGSGQAPTPPPQPPAIDYEQAGRDARVVLRAALGDTEPRVRVSGSDGVGAVKDGDSQPRLLELAIQDPDHEVRGHAAAALGVLGAAEAREALARAEKAAPAPLRVWYAGALAALGQRDARKRLIKYARDKDLAVAFRASLVLAELSEPGDDDAIDALERLAAREAELNDVAPYAGAVLLSKLAGLRHDRARTVLYQLLESDNERARLAAAEGLARLGDEAALAPLKRTLDDDASPNRLVAAVALIGLGDYAGFELLGERLDDPEPEVRRLAARGLGEVGEKDSVAALLPLLQDQDGTVRVATAVALVFIVGLDPKLLAQASIDWAKGALGSEDWAVRQAAAGVLGDLAEEDAVPLLAQAIVDPDKNVRRSAARSARKLKSPEAGKVVAEAALVEKDPEVQADQVRALGTIADPGTLEVLRVLAEQRDLVGVLASGSMIAVGDPSGATRLEQAVVDRKIEVRQVAIEASALAKDPIVVPTLVIAARDRVFAVRFSAAEVLGQYQAEAAVATPVLEEGLTQKSFAVQGRARAALIGYGMTPMGGATPSDLLDSLDPEVRKSAAPELETLIWEQARPLVRRMLADPDPGVRMRGLDVAEAAAPKQRREVIKLYKGVIEDGDPLVRYRAKSRLSRIVEPTAATPTAITPPTPTPAPPPDAQPAAAPVPDAGVAVDSSAVEEAAADAAAALADAQAAGAGLEPIAKELAAAIDEPSEDDANVRKVVSLVRDAKDVRDKVAAASARARQAADAATRAAKAAPSAKATEQAAAARKAADEAAALAKALVAATDKLDDQADDYAKDEGDVEMLLSSADSALAAGKLSEAKRDLDKAAKMAAASGGSYPALKFSYARLYDAQAKRAKSDDDRLPLLKKAKQNYDAFASRGSGPKVARARERSQELAEEIAELESEAP